MSHKKPKRWILRIFSTLVAGMVLLILLVFISSANLKKKLDTAEKPEQIVRYEQIQAAIKQETASTDSEAPETIEAPLSDEDLSTLQRRFSAFDRLLGKVQRQEARDRDSFWQDFQQWDRKPYPEWTEDEWRRFTEYFSQQDALLREIQALVAKGGPVYPLNFEDGLAMELPHLARIRNMTRWLGYGAAAQARLGNYDTAYDYLRSAFDCGALLEEEPILISYLVEKACNGVAFAVMDSVIPPGAFSASQTEALIAMARERSELPWGMESLQGEGYMYQSILITPQVYDRQELSSLIFGHSANVPATAENALLRFYQSPFSAPVRQINYSTFMEVNRELYRLSQQPQYLVQTQINALEERIETMPWYQGIAQSAIAAPGILEAQTRDYARYELMWMGLTVEQYHAQHGIYPTTLTTAIPNAPVDPYTGAPYHYEVTGNAFLLYSIGTNLRDDGGQHDLREGDIVWRGSNAPD